MTQISEIVISSSVSTITTKNLIWEKEQIHHGRHNNMYKADYNFEKLTCVTGTVLISETHFSKQQ